MGNDLSRLIKELTAANEAAKQGVEELEKKLSGEQGQGKAGHRQFETFTNCRVVKIKKNSRVNWNRAIRKD